MTEPVLYFVCNLKSDSFDSGSETRRNASSEDKVAVSEEQDTGGWKVASARGRRHSVRSVSPDSMKNTYLSLEKPQDPLHTLKGRCLITLPLTWHKQF